MEDERTRRTIDDHFQNAYYASQHIKFKYWAIMLSLGMANSSDASEILCLSYLLSDEGFETNMLRSNASLLGGVLASAVFFGMLLGGLVVGTMGDAMGRRPMLIMGLSLNAVAGIASALAPNIFVMSFLRFVAGVGIGASVPPLFTLVTELSPPSHRGLFITICASFWMIGSIYVALVALFCFQFWYTGWRVFALLSALPSAISVLFISNLAPESPRFLAVHNKHEEAVTVANYVTQSMDYHDDELQLEDVLYHYPPAQQEQASLSHKSYWEEFVSSVGKLYMPSLTNTTIGLQIAWFGLSFGSYGILTWINSLFVEVHLNDIYWNTLLFAIANLPGNIFTGVYMDIIGRRSMLSYSILLSALSLLVFAYFAGSHSQIRALGIVASACIFQACSVSAWNAIDALSSESFPTLLRSTGMGVCAASGRIGSLVAQYVNASLVGNPVAVLLIASMALLGGAVVPCFLPGEDWSIRPLEDKVIAQQREPTTHIDIDTEIQ